MYTVIVQFPSVTLVDLSAEEIRDSLQTLEGDNRLDASAIKNLPGTSPGGTMTGEQIVTAINASGSKVDADNVNNLPKSQILHAESSLNKIFTGDPRKPSWQAGITTGSILAQDYIAVAEVYQSEIFANGDWLVAKVDNPGFVFSDTTKWEVKKFADTTVENVFRQHVTGADSQSGIESIPGGSQATGNHSFAPGYHNLASGEGSTALGEDSKATRKGEVAMSSGKFYELGDVQHLFDNMRLETTNATPQEVSLPFKFACENGKTYVLKIQILARVGTGGSYAKGVRAKEWEYKFLVSIDDNGFIYNTGGFISNSNLGDPSISAIVTVVPDIDATGPPPIGIFKGLKIMCTGLNSTTIRWGAFIESFELKY